LGICLVVFAGCGDDGMVVMDSGGADASPDTATDSATPDAPPPDALPDTSVPPPPPCTEFEDATVLGNVEGALLNEVSGVAASRANADVLWVHNDSGDMARVFALRTDGGYLGEYLLPGATNRDWEDMAIGPGPTPGTDYLYVGDHGDNAARDTGMGRAGITVYRAPEPTVSASMTPVATDLAGVEALPLVYPAGPHDCESLMVDPDTADLYLLTKENDGMSELYVARAPLMADVETTLELVGTLTFGAGATPGGPFATGGDISPTGNALLIRTYSSVLLFVRPAGGTIVDMLMESPSVLPAASEMQGEAVAWRPDGLGYYTVSEFVNPPVHFYAASASCVP